jgi:glucose/arabinose dehydrogenase
MWAHETEVEINGDCGLLGMALDPQFASNRYLYLLYAVDPDSNGVDDDSLHYGRLVRYQTSLADPDRIDESTRTILFGTSWADGPPVASGTHSVGCLRFGADGTLLVSVGEGAHYSGGADSGGRDPDLFTAGRTPADQDHGAFRARMLNSLGGKVLRLDPATGHGVPGNPWYSGDGSDVASRIWALGLRNPFRFTVRPGTGSSVPANADPGALFIGDVGWNTWEELDVATSPGQDFGWPCYEGARVNTPYSALAPPGGACPAPGSWTPPAFAISHVSPDSSDPRGLRGNAITTGPFYTHTQFPQPWRGRLLFADFYRGWIRATSVGADQRPFGYDDLAFDMQGPVDMAIEPSTGDLYVACIIDDRVRRIRWAPTADVEGAGGARTAFGAPRPNPSTGSVAFTLTLGAAGPVSFEVLDLAGRVLWRESARDLPAGEHALTWPGTDADGRAAAPGVYLARARTTNGEWLRRCVRLR